MSSLCETIFSTQNPNIMKLFMINLPHLQKEERRRIKRKTNTSAQITNHLIVTTLSPSLFSSPLPLLLNHIPPHPIHWVQSGSLLLLRFWGLIACGLCSKWGGILAATSRSWEKASGLLKRMRSSWITSTSMAMGVGALFPNWQVKY